MSDARVTPPSLAQARRELNQALGGVALAFLALSVTMCTGGVAPRPAQSPDREAAVSRAPTPEPISEANAAPPVAPSPVEPEPVERGVVGQGPLPLGKFFTSLRELRSGSASEHVRVAWLGDSHTAADFWSQAVRGGLQSVFGDGGPGLLHLGLKVYRHGAASVTHEGKWGLKPKAPGFFEPQGDGIFGLGGMVTLPRSNDASAEVELPKSATGKFAWHVLYRLPEPHSRFVVKLGAAAQRVDAPHEPSQAGISRRVFEADARDDFKIVQAAAEPEFFGVIAESRAPGVVIDTLGINGARAATATSWNREAWIEELAWRAPKLVILAYGSNEVGDSHAPWRYGAQYQELVDRIRSAAPEAECLILGPSERDLPDWTTNPRVFEIEDVQRQAAANLGCAFFSVVEAMGGPGTLREWAFSKPSLARKDRVHLTAAGYRFVGEKLLNALQQSYLATFPNESWP